MRLLKNFMEEMQDLIEEGIITEDQAITAFSKALRKEQKKAKKIKTIPPNHFAKTWEHPLTSAQLLLFVRPSEERAGWFEVSHWVDTENGFINFKVGYASRADALTYLKSFSKGDALGILENPTNFIDIIVAGK